MKSENIPSAASYAQRVDASVPERIRGAFVAAGNAAERLIKVVDAYTLAPAASLIARAMPNQFLAVAVSVALPAAALWGAVATGSAWAALPAAWLIGVGVSLYGQADNQARYWPTQT
jgi:hypothetical protein